VEKPVPPVGTPPTHGTYAGLAACFTAFAIYGSLVPLKFVSMPLQDALARFSQIPYLQLGIGSRADLVSNLLLFVPLGFLWTAACRVDRRSRFGAIAAGIGVFAVVSLLSLAVEFTQIFFPARTVSLNDIFAETAGGAIGIAAWQLVGQEVTEWLRAFFAERARPSVVLRLLTAYVVGFFISQLMPFDITLDLGELAQKYREGRVILLPFGYLHPSKFLMLWDFGGDIVLNAPAGALAYVVLMKRDRHGARLRAFAAGFAFAALIELLQVFIFSRYADVTDLVTGSLGIVLGIALGHRFGSPATVPYAHEPTPGKIRLWPAIGVVAWTAALLSYHWFPFNFTLTREMFEHGRATLLAVPFRSYYLGSEFHAFTEAARKFLLALPLGVLMRLAWPSGQFARLQTAVLSTMSFGLLTSIEVGQVFLPERVADLTDAMIGEAGVLVGLWLVRLLGGSGVVSRRDPRNLVGTQPPYDGAKGSAEPRE